jgi:hypothetical protein
MSCSPNKSLSKSPNGQNYHQNLGEIQISRKRLFENADKTLTPYDIAQDE